MIARPCPAHRRIEQVFARSIRDCRAAGADGEHRLFVELDDRDDDGFAGGAAHNLTRGEVFGVKGSGHEAEPGHSEAGRPLTASGHASICMHDARPDSCSRTASPTRVAPLQGLGRRHPIADRSAPESRRVVRLPRAGGARTDAAECLPTAGLKNAGVVESRREGTWTYYKLAAQPDAHCGRQLDSLVRSFASRSTLKKDVERLIKVRGPAACR